MKKAIAIILQFFLFLIIFGAFSLFPPFDVEHILGTTPAGTRIFIVDGLLLAFAVYVLILLIELLTKRLRGSLNDPCIHSGCGSGPYYEVRLPHPFRILRNH